MAAWFQPWIFSFLSIFLCVTFWVSHFVSWTIWTSTRSDFLPFVFELAMSWSTSFVDFIIIPVFFETCMFSSFALMTSSSALSMPDQSIVRAIEMQSWTSTASSLNSILEKFTSEFGSALKLILGHLCLIWVGCWPSSSFVYPCVTGWAGCSPVVASFGCFCLPTWERANSFAPFSRCPCSACR